MGSMSTRRRDDDGLIGEVMEMAFEVPLAGLVAGVLFGGVAAFIHFYRPMPDINGVEMPWLNDLFALLFAAPGVAGLFAGAIGFLRDLVKKSHKGLGDAKPRSDPTPPPAATADVPACSVCGRPTARKLARTGPHAGRPFWGCTAFPRCRGIVNVVARHH